MYVHVSFATNGDRRKEVLPVDEQVKRVDYGTIGRVLERDDAISDKG